jgi:hypothetical protein
MEKKNQPEKPGPHADTYAKVTNNNTEAWTYEKAVEVDKEEAEEASDKD